MRQPQRFLLVLLCLALLIAASCAGQTLFVPLPEQTALQSPEAPPYAADETATPAPVDTPTPAPTLTPYLPARLSVPTLMYHHIQVLGRRNNTTTWREVTVTPKDFEEQMAYLAAHNYHTVTFADLIAAFENGRRLPENPVILTFDDAWEEQYTSAYPILLQYGLKGTFFVPTSYVDSGNGTLTWEQVQEMSRNGMEFGSHSVTHPFMTRQGPAGARWELATSKEALEQHLGQKVVAFAYPFGAYSALLEARVQDAGYKAAVTIQQGEWAERDKLLALHRTGIPYGLSLKNFERVLQRLSASEPAQAATPGATQAVPVVTPSDIEAMPAMPVIPGGIRPGISDGTPEATPENTPEM